MRARLLFTLLTLGAIAAPGAQVPSPASPQAPPTFRGEANFVRVDMYATDKGQPVEDLTVADVELLEDGAPQRVAAFEHVSVRGGPVPQDSRIEPNTVGESRQLAADARARVFVIFLDTYHTQIEGSAQMRLPLVRFIDRLLGPDDLVALMTPEMSARDITLARKTTIISNIMQQQWTWGRRGRLTDNDPKEELYRACYDATIAGEMKERRRERLTLDALEDLITHLQGLREERKAVITVTEGWRVFGENRQLSRVIDPERGAPIPDPFGTGRRRESDRTPTTGASMTECEADRMALASMDHRTRVREITERANRGNVTFYPVYARGLAANDAPIGPDRPPSPEQDRANLATRQDTLRQLAIETDGLAVIGSNDIDRGMQRILADLSSYYLLGYYSTNTKLDGRFRNITVRVNRPGVQVRARRGYRAPTAAEMTADLTGNAASPSGAVTSAFSAVAGVSARDQFRVRTAVWAHQEQGGVTGDVWVAGEMDYRLRRDVTWTAGATADLSLVSATGQQVYTAPIEIDAATGMFTMRLPSLPLKPGEYALRVRLNPKQGGGLPISDAVRVIVPDTAVILGESVLSHRGPSTGPRFATTADPRFQRSERVRLEHATAAPGAAMARLIDRQGKTLQVPVTISERQDESGGFRWVIAEVALAPLAAGSYAIEVTLGTQTRVTAFSVVP
jgi:VWFA-related protein